MSKKENSVIKSGMLQVVTYNPNNSPSQRPRRGNASNGTSNGNEATAAGTIAEQQKVVMVVYRTFNEHFAVLYPFWGVICAQRPMCKLNLRSAIVESWSSSAEKGLREEFRITTLRDSGGSSITLRTIPSDDGDDQCDSGTTWINALKGKSAIADDNDDEKDDCTKCERSSSGSDKTKRRVSRKSLLDVLNEEASEEYGI